MYSCALMLVILNTLLLLLLETKHLFYPQRTHMVPNISPWHKRSYMPTCFLNSSVLCCLCNHDPSTTPQQCQVNGPNEGNHVNSEKSALNRVQFSCGLSSKMAPNRSLFSLHRPNHYTPGRNKDWINWWKWLMLSEVETGFSNLPLSACTSKSRQGANYGGARGSSAPLDKS